LKDDGPSLPGRAAYPPPMVKFESDPAKPLSVNAKTINWDSVISDVQSVLSLIRARYELHAGGVGRNLFLTTQNISPRAWDMIRFKLALRMVDENREDRRYLMIFGGSSVTAGHDGYFNESYPMIVQRHLTPIFDKLGIEFLARNIAQGANDCWPYTNCYESMGGDDPDWIGWEQSYNCGNEKEVMEALARHANQSKNKAVVHYSASGAFSPSAFKCMPSNDTIPYSSWNWKPSLVGIPDWHPTEDDVKIERLAYEHYHKKGSSDSRFTPYRSNPDYDGVGSYGFNVWINNPACVAKLQDGTLVKNGCNGFDIGKICADKGGMKFMTLEAGKYSATAGHSWHPPRGIHLLRGEFFVWMHSLILLDAIHLVQKELKKISPAEMATGLKKKLAELHVSPKNPPLFCGKKAGGFGCDHKPKCFSNYYPHFPSTDVGSLTSIVVGKTGWSYVGSDFHELSWYTNTGYLDSRPYFHYTNEDVKNTPITDIYRDLHLKVNIQSPPSLIVCGELVGAEFLLDVGGAAHVKTHDGHKEYVPPVVSSLIQLEKAIAPKSGGGRNCVIVHDLPVGSHVLTLRHTTNTTLAVRSSITHVITWEE